MDTVCIDKRSGIPEKRNHVYDDGTLIFCWCMHWLRIRLYIWGIWCFYRICTTDCGTPVMYIGKIPVENGTPEETEEEAKEALEEANLLENDQKL